MTPQPDAGRTAGDRPPRPAPVPEEPAVLPDQTRDESDVGWGGATWRDAPDDERLTRERPPHWE